ncbi:MAG: SUMF1/EgtB/PvdO family nonheme iron enzyme [Chitinivibrionales bacterium]|nr:SUMF1/EgtB/PvdO family nonheme iron enzyme [Chitinivibrionales bacterium]MBD3397167.1 SUMF1/EgtB/PvdO family nonheme iron enzyme [Chitinivibrionales bacterium]
MKMRSAVAVFACTCGVYAAGPETLPSWVDTVAPVVEARPAERVHRRTFSITLRADEKAVIRYSLNTAGDFQEYRKPVPVLEEGMTVVYFYGEDAVGNTSAIDSVSYRLDTRPPEFQVRPDPGRYGAPVTLYFYSNEECRYFRHADPAGTDRRPVGDTLAIDRSFHGYITAVDRAGNRTTSEELTYVIDATTLSVVVEPPGGVYRERLSISFSATPGASIHYSIDPAAATKWFSVFSEPVKLPHGLTVVRYFAKNESGQTSELRKASFVVDTVPPKIRARHLKGALGDTLVLSTREPAAIRYARSPDASLDDAATYDGPIVLARTGRAYVKAVAEDKAGNVSKMFIWEYKYDRTPPVVKASQRSGTFTRPVSLRFTTSEPATVLFTLDGSVPGTGSAIARDSVTVSKPGTTVVKYMAVDEAGNASPADSIIVVLDLTAPTVRARIEGSVSDRNFFVTLAATEGAKIYYEKGAREPTRSSPVYTQRVPLRSGEVLRYFAVDKAGNRSDVYVLDDLNKPVVEVSPEGGVYNAPTTVFFEANVPSRIYWRRVSDSLFVPFGDSIRLAEEGLHTIEYYSESSTGLRSTVRRTEYLIDWSAPRVNVSLRKGAKDSIILFFEANENITLYYTLDGSNPAYSPTTQIAANKFFLSRDRLVLERAPDTRLAFYAEDIAGNQSSVSILDLNKPSAIPSIPSGPDIVHDRMLSISLNTYDDRSQIYYERHGKTPTLRSRVFTEPITLLSSDTIVTFVVDASGYRGDPDTFVYLLDLPPSPQFTTSPDTADIGRPLMFDASRTVDQESPVKRLIFKWDFDGDGAFDAAREGSPLVKHTYTAAGRYTVTLEVADPRKRTARAVREVLVRGYCPEGMAFVARAGGGSFCIDRYEWPNRKGGAPATEVSWVRARMYCTDAGKRLCTAEEWRYACSGGAGPVGYPYGQDYRKGRCPSEGESAYPSGGFTSCGEGFGLRDMVGNAWEWVVDKEGRRAQMAGGSFRNGKSAHCGQSAAGDITQKSKDVGFRCCR